jgi:AhpD family alkylhydroperoxidase
MPAPAFPDHTLESAPDAARRSMEAVVNKQGHLPAAVSRLATSPQLLDGFLKISAIFESTTLDPLSREVLIMTIATRNDCHVCVAMHTAKLTALGADADLIAALQDFLAHGYTPQNALEVVLGIGAYTMSTLANRMTGAPVDPQLAEFAPAPM